MNSLSTTFKNIKNHDIILGIILIIYILGGYQTPTEMAPYITNFISYIIMVVLVSITLLNSNIIVALLLGISFIILIQRSNASHPINVMPSQTYRDNVMNNLNSDNTFNSNSSSNNNSSSNINNIVNVNNSNGHLEEHIITNMATVNLSLIHI